MRVACNVVGFGFFVVSAVALPNFLIFQPDDFEWMASWAEEPQRPPDPDAGEAPNFPTTNLDKLRSEGVVFTRAYSSSTMCAPSRFSVLTGRYASRSEYSQANAGDCDPTITDVSVPKSLLDYTTDTLASALKLVSPTYKTGTFGKWHISSHEEGDQSTSEYAAQQAKAKAKGFDVAEAFYIENMDDRSVREYGYTHNLEYIVAEATAFFQDSINEGRPFFAYVNPTAPHSPDALDALTDEYRQLTPEGTIPVPGTTMLTREKLDQYLVEYQDLDEEGLNLALATIWVDDAFGALYDYLEIRGVLDETVVVFEMDHGVGVTNRLFEHGVRIAMFARYPPLFETPRVVPALVSNIDIFPTFLDIAAEAAEVPIPEGLSYDGESWKTLASGETCGEDRTLFLEREKHRGAVTATHKLMRLSDCSTYYHGFFPDSAETVQLYDLVPMYSEGGANDAEQNNIAGSEADVLATMNCLLDDHMAFTAVGGPAPATPCPATPAPATPAPTTGKGRRLSTLCPTPATPAPATPAPPAPATPAPTAGKGRRLRQASAGDW